MEKSLLGSVCGYANEMAKIISDTVDTDVLIVDENREVVGSAFRYLDLYSDITNTALIAGVISGNRNIIIESKSKIGSCRKCPGYKNKTCKMDRFVGVPIRYAGHSIGAIALILKKNRAKTLFAALESTLSFLEQIAILLSNKIEERSETLHLQNKLNEVENIIDILYEAIVYTDYYGNILHANQRFRELMHADEKVVGMNIKDLLPINEITNYFDKYEDIAGSRITFELNGALFHGLVLSRKLYISKTEFGTLFYFRPISGFMKKMNVAERGTMVTLDWLHFFCSSKQISYARQLAKTDKHILIHGPLQDLNLLLAKAIFNASERRLNDLFVIYSDNCYRDLFEYYMLDEYGLLREADQCIVVIMNPENTPLYIQKQLIECMEIKHVNYKNINFRTNVRFIMCTEMDPVTMIKDGLVYPKLIEMIGNNIIELSDVTNDRESFNFFIESGMQYYKKLYHNNSVTVPINTVNFLWNHFGDISAQRLEKLMECLAMNYNGSITEQQVMSGPFLPEELVALPEENIKKITKEKIQDLLKRGYKKTEIAQMLGISRASLYRALSRFHES